MKSLLEKLTMDRGLDIILAVLAVFAPIKAAVITTMMLTFIDLITGIWAAKHRGEAITSQGLKRTVIKLSIYQIATLCAFLAQKYLVLDIMPVCTLVTSLVGITELKSILENLDCVSGGSFFSALVSKLNEKTKSPPQDPPQS